MSAGFSSSLRARAAALLLMTAAAGPCAADIYGYVDDAGVAHLSKVPLDSRYILFKKEFAAPQPELPPVAETSAGPTTAVSDLAAGRPYAALITRIAKEQGVDAALLHAVVAVESGYNAQAKSVKGASGLMQLMPDTALRFGVSDVWNPMQNLRGGARYLRALLAMFDDKLDLALAAYNAGEGAVIGSGNRIPPYPETRRYVPRVLEHYERYRPKRARVSL